MLLSAITGDMLRYTDEKEKIFFICAGAAVNSENKQK